MKKISFFIKLVTILYLIFNIFGCVDASSFKIKNGLDSPINITIQLKTGDIINTKLESNKIYAFSEALIEKMAQVEIFYKNNKIHSITTSDISNLTKMVENPYNYAWVIKENEILPKPI